MLDRERVLAHLQEEERLLGARIYDLAALVVEDGEVRWTGFLDPGEREVAAGVLARLDGLAAVGYGGYRASERQRLAIIPEYFPREALDPPVRILQVRGDFRRHPVSHRDYLGALLATGIRRDKVGDLLVTAGGAQLVVASEVAPHVLAELRQVGPVAVQVEEIDPEQLDVPPEQVKEIRTTVSSLRLDAIAAAGFGTSRTKMAREIKAERVKVNWRPTDDPAADVKPGDVISLRGRGRVIVEEVTGLSKKGRTGVVLKRLL